MKALVRIACATAGLFVFVSIFWLPRGAAQSGITYTDTVTATIATHTLKHPTGLFVEAGLPGTPSWCADNINYPCLWIVDSGNSVIRVFNTANQSLTSVAGDGNAGYVNATLTASEFNNPTGIDVVQFHALCFKSVCVWEHVYVTDSANYVVRMFCTGQWQVYDSNSCEFGSYPPGCNRNCSPVAVTTYVGNHTKGYVNGLPSQSEFAHGGAMHSDLGYMVDTENHAIRVVGSSVGTFAGTGSPGLVNGPVASAQFNFPTKLAKDSAGNVYVADAGNNVIRKIDTSGNVTTFAGSGVAGHADGTGGSAQFRLPSGIVYNSNDGALYVADAGNNLVRRITAAGTVTTYAGNGTGGLVNGALLQSEFYHPSDIAVLGTNIVVSDTYNNAIRIINTSASTVATLID